MLFVTMHALSPTCGGSKGSGEWVGGRGGAPVLFWLTIKQYYYVILVNVCNAWITLMKLNSPMPWVECEVNVGQLVVLWVHEYASDTHITQKTSVHDYYAHYMLYRHSTHFCFETKANYICITARPSARIIWNITKTKLKGNSYSTSVTKYNR